MPNCNARFILPATENAKWILVTQQLVRAPFPCVTQWNSHRTIYSQKVWTRLNCNFLNFLFTNDIFSHSHAEFNLLILICDNDRKPNKSSLCFLETQLFWTNTLKTPFISNTYRNTSRWFMFIKSTGGLWFWVFNQFNSGLVKVLIKLIKFWWHFP